MNIRAFLSYSSLDREVVEGVARELRRPHAVVDRFSFESGTDLVKTVQSAIEQSAIFVLFASRNSLSSPWVREESFTGAFYAASGHLRYRLVVILDDRINVDELPFWLRRFKAHNTKSSKTIARLVQSEIDQLTSELQSPFFVGRAAESVALQAAFVPTAVEGQSNIVVIRGLPGVGRRTLITRVARASIQAQRLITIRVEVGESTVSLTAKLADLMEPAPSPREAIRNAKAYQTMDGDVAAQHFVTLSRGAQDSGELVLLYDEGGLLNNSGHVTDSLMPLFSALSKDSNLIVPIATSRRPVWNTSQLHEPELVSINPLKLDEVNQLIALFARKLNIALDSGDTSKMANLATGYPPSVPVILGQYKLYGKAFLLRADTGGISYSPRRLVSRNPVGFTLA